MFAKLAGVSYATVSKALNGNYDVKADTRQKILNIAEDLDYTPNSIARDLVNKSTKTIGFIVTDILNPFFTEIALGMEIEASKNDYAMFLCNTNWNQDKENFYLSNLLEKRVAGIVITPISKQTFAYAKKYAKKLPIVLLTSDVVEDTVFNFALTDNYKCTYMATEYLLKLGHRKIALIGSNPNAANYTGRINGYKGALNDYGIVSKHEFTRSCDREFSGYSKEDAFNLTIELLKSSDIPTAIVAMNDLCALGIMEAAEKLGYSIPNDISVIGCDDIPIASLMKAGLTTIRQPKLELGAAAFNILNSHFREGRNSCTKSVILDPQLIIRGSCKNI